MSLGNRPLRPQLRSIPMPWFILIASTSANSAVAQETAAMPPATAAVARRRDAPSHVDGRLRVMLEACLRHDAPLAARAVALVQVDAGGDGPDRRQVDVVVGEHVRLVGGLKPGAARAFVRVDLARRVGIGAQGARRAGPETLAALLLLLRLCGDIGLLSARGRQQGVGRRVRRLDELRFQLRNPRQQLQHQRFQAIGISANRVSRAPSRA